MNVHNDRIVLPPPRPWMRKYRLQHLPSSETIAAEIRKVEMDIEEDDEAFPVDESGVKDRRQSLIHLQTLQNLQSDKSIRMDQFVTREAYLEAQNELLRARVVSLLNKNAELQAHVLERGRAALDTTSEEEEGPVTVPSSAVSPEDAEPIYR
jgi:cell division protein FtsB